MRHTDDVDTEREPVKERSDVDRGVVHGVLFVHVRER
jgi:hypothetical protein